MKAYKDFTKEQFNRMDWDELRYWHRSGGWGYVERIAMTLGDYMYSDSIYMALVRPELGDEWQWVYSKGAVEYGLEYLD